MKNVRENVIEVKNIHRSFDEVEAVKKVSFKVPKGTLYALLGPNGAGKTTIINMLSCNLPPDKGDAEIMSYSVKNHPEDVRRYIGICPQENVLYSHLSVYENLIFFGKMYEIPLSQLKARAEELILKVGLEEKKKARIDTLSGGQKRRVNLLAGLIHDPQVIFLDEPTAGLDPQTRRLLWEYIQELKMQKKTIILTTHYMDEADILSDCIGIMDHGEIIAEDTPENLKESIGKGDNLVFKLNGINTIIESVLLKLLNEKSIVSFNPMDGKDNAYRITALDGIGRIGQFVNAFLEQKIQVEDISIRANSLENVFLALTGKNLRE